MGVLVCVMILIQASVCQHEAVFYVPLIAVPPCLITVLSRLCRHVEEANTTNLKAWSTSTDIISLISTMEWLSLSRAQVRPSQSITQFLRVATGQGKVREIQGQGKVREF